MQIHYSVMLALSSKHVGANATLFFLHDTGNGSHAAHRTQVITVGTLIHLTSQHGRHARQGLVDIWIIS